MKILAEAAFRGKVFWVRFPGGIGAVEDTNCTKFFLAQVGGGRGIEDGGWRMRIEGSNFDGGLNAGAGVGKVEVKQEETFNTQHSTPNAQAGRASGGFLNWDRIWPTG